MKAASVGARVNCHQGMVLLAVAIGGAMTVGCGGQAVQIPQTETGMSNGRQDAVATYVTGTVRSKDGTTIGYRRIGHGPALIIVEGAVSTAQNYDELARALADDFTVFVADRRGRGMSPCRFSDDAASIARDVEDVDALVRASGAQSIFGLSSGAIVALESTRALPALQKAILYEPPFYPRRDVPRAKVALFHRQVAEGRLPAALVTVGEIVKLGPQFPAFVPRRLRELATRSAMFVDDIRGTGEYASLSSLIPAMRFDFRVLEERGDEVASFNVVGVPVLLLGGTKSPGYLGEALDALVKVLPNVQRKVLQGLDHSGPWNVDVGGAPQIVAKNVRTFLKGDLGTTPPLAAPE